MPLTSYVAWTRAGAAAELAAQVRALPGCELLASDRAEVFVVVTDTPDEATHHRVHEQLSGLAGLEGLALVSVFSDPT